MGGRRYLDGSSSLFRCRKGGTRFLGCGRYSEKEHTVVALRHHLTEMVVEMRLYSNGGRAKGSYVDESGSQILGLNRIQMALEALRLLSFSIFFAFLINDITIYNKLDMD